MKIITQLILITLQFVLGLVISEYLVGFGLGVNPLRIWNS